MSRVGPQIIPIPESVNVTVSGMVVSAKGPKGELSLSVTDGLKAELGDGCIRVLRLHEDRALKALHGLNRMLIANLIKGVFEGHVKELTIEGVGFKGSVQEGKLMLSLGFASPVELLIPEGIDVNVSDGVNIVVSGVDKQLVGDFAARIKSQYPADPYKGKGVRFKGEFIRRKVGKTVA